ncbi:MAG: alpha/beta hydrolase [Clostridium sp.]|nr:alpha/beta hydrolase [Clostridium sp.]
MIIKRDVWYSPTQKMRGLHIYLPDYYYDTDERMPVMYFFDGHNLFFNEDATFGTCWGLKEFLDRWDKPMIIVGIECGHEGDERLNEYCPYQVSWGFLQRIHGIGDATMRWIVDELKPMIDREYRTYHRRECTAIAGASMGGLMAVYGIIRYNQWFSKAVCVSGTIYPCMPQIYEDIRRCSMSPDTRVYLSWGTREARGVSDHTREDKNSHAAVRVRSLAQHLSYKGAVTRVHCQVGGGHCEADWAEQVPGFMNFLWKDQ